MNRRDEVDRSVPIFYVAAILTGFGIGFLCYGVLAEYGLDIFGRKTKVNYAVRITAEDPPPEDSAENKDPGTVQDVVVKYGSNEFHFVGPIPPSEEVKREFVVRLNKDENSIRASRLIDDITINMDTRSGKKGDDAVRIKKVVIQENAIERFRCIKSDWTHDEPNHENENRRLLTYYCINGLKK